MDWIETGEMSHIGLCSSLPLTLQVKKSFQLIKPTLEECVVNRIEGGSKGFWGIMDLNTEWLCEFTSLRQTIVLLCAVMEEEKF